MSRNTIHLPAAAPSISISDNKNSIPGPIEFADPVLLANATPGTSHVSPAFIPIMGDCLRMLRSVLYAEQGVGNQAFLIAGSGTMGWDAVGVNLIEKGDDVVS
jgi:alanine-glyoxylate transaminase/serine-glyoxylate transaminase/serine-pyruvate transaminase